MKNQNENLLKEVTLGQSALKEIIVNYVGNVTNPEDDAVTVEQVIDVFAEQFPELLLALAEENWINGYTQALSDLDFTKKDEELHKKEKE
jgi:hypothetical protein